LRCLAYVANNFTPWTAAAGINYGQIPEYGSVAYPYVSQTVKNSSYGQGNCINSILYINNGFYLYGDRTMLRDSASTTNKLTALHSAALVNYIVKGLAQIGLKYIFEPNDQTLLTQINLDFNSFLTAVVNGRGIEPGYRLVCDSSNNNSTTRNARQVVVALAVIPVDVLETLYINASVFSSGAQLNSVTTGQI
jgi:phage tail sheath protein FI